MLHIRIRLNRMEIFFLSVKAHQLKIALVHSSNKHILSIYYIPSSVVHKTSPCVQEAYRWNTKKTFYTLSINFLIKDILKIKRKSKRRFKKIKKIHLWWLKSLTCVLWKTDLFKRWKCQEYNLNFFPQITSDIILEDPLRILENYTNNTFSKTFFEYYCLYCPLPCHSTVSMLNIKRVFPGICRINTLEIFYFPENILFPAMAFSSLQVLKVQTPTWRWQHC